MPKRKPKPQPQNQSSGEVVPKADQNHPTRQQGLLNESLYFLAEHLETPESDIAFFRLFPDDMLNEASSIRELQEMLFVTKDLKCMYIKSDRLLTTEVQIKEAFSMAPGSMAGEMKLVGFSLKGASATGAFFILAGADDPKKFGKGSADLDRLKRLLIHDLNCLAFMKQAVGDNAEERISAGYVCALNEENVDIFFSFESLGDEDASGVASRFQTQLAI